MMNELITWIDKSYEVLKRTDLFKKYFNDLEMEIIEETYFLTNSVYGIDITFTENLIAKSVHLTHKAFQDELPFNLKFNYNQPQVHAIMGVPNFSGGGFKDFLLGYVNEWEKFYYESFSIHIQYSKDIKNIELITIGSLKFENDRLPE